MCLLGLGLDKLYSFFPTYYSILIFSKFLPVILFKLPIILFILPIIHGRIWPEQPSHLALYTMIKQ